MAAPVAARGTPEEQLTWEAAQRPRSGIAAIIAGVATLAAAVVFQAAFTDFPSVLALDAIRDAAGQALPGGQTGLKTLQVRFYADHVPALVGSGILAALGFAAMAIVFGFLYAATSARTQMTRVILGSVLVGAILCAAAELAVRVAVALNASSFVDEGEFTSQAARDALGGTALQLASAVRSLAILPLAVGIVVISLSAMRVGLLSRFMGVLGIIVGVLLVIPQVGSSVPIVPSFWLVALGLLILGRWPNAVPPAWASGKAEPWPTQQQVRERREAARTGREPLAPAGEPAGSEALDAPPAKRKRKRR